ncbi:hypothetical protein [Peteryoungia algae]|nr:hypothetical protein [Rhizobium sp. SSM4.3]
MAVFIRTVFVGFLVLVVPAGIAFGQNCDGARNILIVDRTSQLNAAESRALEDGIAIMFEDRSFGGELMIGEVRGSSLSSEWIYESCVARDYVPSIACEGVLSDSNRPQHFLDDPFDWMKNAVFGGPQREPNTKAVLLCEAERAEAETQRAEDKTKVLEELRQITKKAVSSSPTALGDTIFRVAQARCAKTSCNLYVFSNLLDAGWKELVAADVQQSEAGARAVTSSSRLNGATVKINSVMVWGFGFDEQDGEQKFQLSDDAALKLLEYWKAFFTKLSGENVYIGFEMPQ